MRVPFVILMGAAWLAEAQSSVPIPPLKTSLQIEGQPVDFRIWGDAAAAAPDAFRLSLTVDLDSFQRNLTAILAAQLNRNDRCGDRLTVQHAALAPAAPSAILTADVHYERFACAKAFGKEITKRLAGGNAQVEINLTPSIGDNRVFLAGEVRKMDADGSLGELLHSGSMGDSLKTKIANAVQNSLQKPLLPAEIEQAAALETVHFADGGDGKVWLTLKGALHLNTAQLQQLTTKLPH